MPNERSDAAPDLVLASSSPRRAEILRRLGLPFEVSPPEVAETFRAGESPEAAAARLAAEKAAARARPGALALGCDTIVVDEAGMLGKPADRDDAVAMLGRLAGRAHRVHTGIALASPERVERSVETTRVWMRPLDPREREEYVDTGEPMDKAGAYGIQALGAAIVERIDGDYFNVMGLPVQRLQELLLRFGWRYAFGRLAPVEAPEPAAARRQGGPGGDAAG